MSNYACFIYTLGCLHFRPPCTSIAR